MRRFKAVILEHGYASIQHERDVIEPAGGQLVDGGDLPIEKALALCEDAEGIMVRRVQITPELIKTFKKCKMLLRYGVGVDNIDMRAATEAGIIVGHVPVYCQDEVSSHAIALLLACIRQVVLTNKKMETGGWDVHREDFVYRMAGKTLGLVEFGTLAQAVARKMQGWNLRLLACDPYAEPETARPFNVTLAPFETVLKESDYISMHVPLLPETRHMINRSTLCLMKSGAIVVNTARGPVVDGTALLDSLDNRHLASAALDVFEEEPLPIESPLRHHPRLIVTDHMAWYSEDSQIELQRTAAEEIARGCTGGLPRAIANPEVLDRLGRADEWEPNHLARWQRKRAAAAAALAARP
jgi:D-3-phosphoglycerate dehydrogenase